MQHTIQITREKTRLLNMQKCYIENVFVSHSDFTKHNISIGFTDEFFVLTFEESDGIFVLGLFFFFRQISTDFFLFS